jgi:RimJ/RimL family protein N-acetyltransferase
VPSAWPGPALVERAFSASLDRIRENPAVRLWGDRLLLTRTREPEVVGSVVFHGKPGADGLAEIAYGVEEKNQCKGYATEGVKASLDWALAEPNVSAVEATTFPWHRASIRVLEKAGMRPSGARDHETLGELLVFSIAKPRP